MERLQSAISGSHGAIGEHLVQKLEQQGHSVIRLDRSGIVPTSDYIFDLAAYGNRFDQTEKPKIYEANVMRLMKMLDYTKESDYRAFLVTSSSSVLLPYQTFYSESKKAAESLALLFAKEYGKPIVLVRPYTIVGVGESDEHLIPTLIRSGLDGTSMPFVPGPVHDFLDVDDFVDALWIIAKNAKDNPGEIYGVGKGIQYTNTQVKNIVEKVIEKTIPIREIGSLRPYDTKNWKADTTKIESLGWRPKKTLEQTVIEMVHDELGKRLK